MKKTIVAAAALGLGGVTAHAGGLDRSGQSVSAIFADSGTLSFSVSRTMPDVTGTDALGADYDVGQDYTQYGLGYTRALSDKLTLGVIFDQPYGADILYDVSPLASTLGGTRADLNSHALTVIGKYNVTDRVSVFGGLKLQGVDAEVDLNGRAYASAISVQAVTGAFNAALPAGAPALSSTTLGAALQGDPTAAAAIDGTYGANTTAGLDASVTGQVGSFLGTGGYTFDMANDNSVGGVIGAAYEIPDIALRFAATYHFEMDHSADTVENIFGMVVPGTVDYVTPQSLNLEFQTGIAADTLLTASYRWTDFSAVDVIPVGLGSDLVNLDDSHRFTLGVARRFNESLVGLVSLQYEDTGDDDLVSPLGPTDGQIGISIGGRYSKDNLNISGGINYTKLGDARAEVAGQPQATFSGSSALTVGLNLQMVF